MNSSSDLGSALDSSSGSGQRSQGISLKSFLASLAAAVAIFAIEVLLFLILKGKLTRIYQPRTYLVPERERTKESPAGLLRWIGPVFRTSNSEFIQKCGLDAYFFLRYLRMLLKIFLPLSFLILPILLPLNTIGGKDNTIQSGSSNGTRWNVTGLDQLAWGNVTPEHTDRYWAHLVLAVVVIIYVCAIFFDELRGYIRLRQAYLTSPQHRLRASATTVLVRAIPQKWLSAEALDSLYDVFPGGVRNIWINRNFDELNEKVKQRNTLALTLESAETELIKKCKRAQLKQAKVDAKNAGKSTKNVGNCEEGDSDKKATQMMGPGISSGDIHQVAHTVREVLEKEKASSRTFVPVVGGGLNAVGHGMSIVGKSVLGGLKKVERGGQPNINPDVGESSRAPETSKTNDGRPFWKRKSSSSSRPSVKPDTDPDGDSVPLTRVSTTEKQERHRGGRKEWDRAEGEQYPLAYNEDIGPDCGEPLWKRYIREKDRDTMRLPVFGLSWMPSLPLIGKKVDTIDYCRKEVARLNLEIEIDQQHPERFPLMNSAFIQFDHQVAAHMACQAVSHHLPKQMAPRSVEISPDDVIWDNMSIKWWERYLRAFGILVIVAGMVIGWAFPVAFTGLLSQLSYLEGRFTWLSWLSHLPEWALSTMQGVLPPLFLAILMALLPLILRFLSKAQGVQTGMAIELTVQNYYFAFLFVQLFLVVSISSSFSTIADSITEITSWPDLLAQNIPKSSNYFFSYMILQAMSVSAGALVQIFNLVSWFVLAPVFDNTARMKWARTTNLNQMQWGTFFPVYTTLASIGLIYCVIAPFIMVFNVITFGVFWFVYRYNTLYVTKFRFDTGGLLFPKAINQLFTGIYVMELCLVGLFFLVRDEQDQVACKGQAVCMIAVFILTVGYQFFLNEGFSPLIRYLPITLEDDAVRRDEEFARAQRTRLGLPEDQDDQESIEQQLAEREQAERDADRETKEIELGNTKAEKERRKHFLPQKIVNVVGVKRQSWADRSQNRQSKYFGADSDNSAHTSKRMREQLAHDEEGQAASSRSLGHALFAGIHDELEDLTPDERDQLVQRAFQHEALRAKRPVIWIPRDGLGVSDDEVYRTQRFSKHIWISNEYQALDGKCRTIFSRSPPDFSEVDLIQL